MIADKTFPFQEGEKWRIKKISYWWIDGNSYSDHMINLDNEKSTTAWGDDTCYIFCNKALKSAKFSSEPQDILDIFKKNNLVPKFDDEKANIFYRISKIFFKYDAAAINQSPIKFYKAVTSAADDALNYLQQYETAAQIPPKISVSYVESPRLSPEENNLLAERQNFLVKQFDPCTDDTIAQILLFKAQAEELEACIDKINHSKNSLRVLAELEKVPRVSFEFFTENLTQIITFAQGKIDYFIARRAKLITS